MEPGQLWGGHCPEDATSGSRCPEADSPARAKVACTAQARENLGPSLFGHRPRPQKRLTPPVCRHDHAPEAFCQGGPRPCLAKIQWVC
ncbi:hypothetical protein NN561_020251 [Cricetulus griseus]